MKGAVTSNLCSTSQLSQSGQMCLRTCRISVIGQDAFQIESQSFLHTGSHQFGARIQEARREMRDAAEAGKEVGGEEELELLAIPAGMAVSVPRHMHSTQAVPDVQGIAIVDPAVRGEGLEAQE